MELKTRKALLAASVTLVALAVAALALAVRENRAYSARQRARLAAALDAHARERVAEESAARLERFRGEVAALSAKYLATLPLPEAEERFRECEEGADFIASREGLCGYKTCVALAYKLAYDKVEGTSRAAEAIEPLVRERISGPVEKAVEAYAKWNAEFRRELQSAEEVFSLDLAAASHRFSDEVSVLGDSDAAAAAAAVDAFASGISEHAKSAAFASAGVALEAAFAESTFAAVRRIALRVVTKFLASSAARAGASVAAGAGAAAADGPLPIGDVIGAAVAVGGLAWTAYDIYEVSKSMPDELRSGMKAEIARTREALAARAREGVERDCGECLASARRRVDEIVGALGLGGRSNGGAE